MKEQLKVILWQRSEMKDNFSLQLIVEQINSLEYSKHFGIIVIS